MPRPTVKEETRDRLADLVDREADVPASILTFEQQLNYLLDHADALDDRVEELEDEVSARGGVNQAPTSSNRFR
jgi:hypothetical protein